MPKSHDNPIRTVEHIVYFSIGASSFFIYRRTDEGRVVYRVRGDQDIWNYIRFICKGDNIGKRNFNEMNFDPDRLAAEMIYVQDTYGKTNGIRLL